MRNVKFTDYNILIDTDVPEHNNQTIAKGYLGKGNSKREAFEDAIEKLLETETLTPEELQRVNENFWLCSPGAGEILLRRFRQINEENNAHYYAGVAME